MNTGTSEDRVAASGATTRAVEVALDPSPSQQRWLRSYAGSMRAAYNWALGEVRDNLALRAHERACGVAEDELTPALSWSRASLTSKWRVRDEEHPWHRDVSIHAFKTGLDNAALALKYFSESKSGKRRGPKVGVPRFKNRRSRQAITFVELADGVDHRHWINPDTRSHVRLMLPQRRTTTPGSVAIPGRSRSSRKAGTAATRSRGSTPTSPTRSARCGSSAMRVARRSRL